MPDRKEIVMALDELWHEFADTLRLRHEYDPNDDAVMIVIHERDIDLLRNVSILLEEQEEVKDAPALLKEQNELLKHEYWRGYNNGRADERGLQEGTIMQTFSPD